jgi:hypothetical protein
MPFSLKYKVKIIVKIFGSVLFELGMTAALVTGHDLEI